MTAYQSTLATIRSNVLNRLRMDATLDAVKVNEWINQAYIEAAQETGCFQTSGSGTLTDGTASYTLPPEVGQIKLLQYSYADGSASKPLRRVRMERLLGIRNGNVANGQAVAQPIYAIIGQNQIELWPAPTTGWSLLFWYSSLPDLLVDDADEPLIQEPYGSQLLESGALVKGAAFKKDPLIGDFEAQYALWLGRFQAWLNRRQGIGTFTDIWHDDIVLTNGDFPFERDW